MGPGFGEADQRPGGLRQDPRTDAHDWANQTEPGAAAMRQVGVPSDAIEAFHKWATDVDVAKKRAGLDVLAKAVPNATVVPIEAPHTLVWYDPERVIAAMNSFLNQSVARTGN